MTRSHPKQGGDHALPELSAAERFDLRRFARWWMVFVVVLSGVNLALKTPTLYKFPGTHDDPVMRVLAFTAIAGCLALVFKFPAVFSPLGRWLERKLRGNVRQVRMRDLLQPGIRKAAFWGGTLQAFYQMTIIALVTELSPSAISAAKACVIIPLAFLELRLGRMKPSGRKWWIRLLASMLFTIVGAGIVIFEGGFKLFANGGILPLVILVLFTLVGNGLLAYAEMQEYDGVHDRVAAAPVYSLARIIVYCATCVVSVIVWGVLHGGWATAGNVVLMCLDRWELVLPIAILGAISDTSRMCVKVLITATFMYTMLALAVVVDILLQIPLKMWWWPEIYDNVHPGWRTVFFAGVGALLLIVSIALHPKPSKKDDPTPISAAVTTSA